MKSPWKSMQALDPGREYLVLASSIPPLSRSSTGRLFRGAGEVRAQLARTEGVVGFSLLVAFTHENPHGRLMADLAPDMGPTKFVRWTISGADGRPSWSEALRRLG